MVNYTSKLLKGAGIIFTASLFSSALAYLIRITLAKKLTTEEFGLFFAVYNVILIVGWIKNFGLSSSIQKFVPEFKLKNDFQKIKSVLLFIFYFTIFTCLILFFVYGLLPSEFINSYFKSVFGKPLLFILLIFIVVDGFSQILCGFFIAVHSFLLYAIRDVIIRSVILVSLLVMEVSVLRVGWIYVAGTSVALLINLFFFLRKFPFFNYRFKKDGALFKEIFAFGAPLVIRDFFGVIMSYTDNLMLVYFRPLTEVALYNIILPTADLLLVIGRPFGRVIFPISSELMALNEKDKLLRLVKQIHKYLFVVLIFFGLFIFTFADFFLNILFGGTYTQGFLGLRILLFGFLFSCMSITSYNVLLGIGKSKEATKATILTNFLNVALNFVLIPFFGKFDLGYIGAIIATVFSSLLLFLLLNYYLWKNINYILPLKSMVLTMITGILFVLLGFVLRQRIINEYAIMLVFLSILLLFYPLCLWLFSVVSQKEAKSIYELLKSYVQKRKEISS